MEELKSVVPDKKDFERTDKSILLALFGISVLIGFWCQE